MTIDTEPDLSVFVLNRLDEHLAAMRDVRERLRPAGPVGLGTRRLIALESITIAEHYAAELTRVLSD
ncbi:hypothetical protein [Paractinoplanes durhamensis]|uniref:Uncharacterized protein n=1 Tax=Paractinoplanes durhamensis TaxID=113563 RepID=A0ABQ3YVT3_9ACTN|nr:hypothetical protein [Actinoplanes durhamensis]GIE01656.1 hypothetical protein Adu01nite_30060 [Actinoplanes durhamensis]